MQTHINSNGSNSLKRKIIGEHNKTIVRANIFPMKFPPGKLLTA